MMRNRRIMGMAVLLLFVFVAVNPNVVSAQSAALSLDFPLTSQEQAARLWELAGHTMARKLFPSVPDSVKPLQQEYLRGNVLGEVIGEKGAAWYAAKHGLIQLLGSEGSGIRQGPDSVYWAPYCGIKTPCRGDPLLIDDCDTTNVAKEVHEIERNNPKAQEFLRQAGQVRRAARLVGRFAGAPGLRWDEYRVAWSRMAQTATLRVISTDRLGIWKQPATAVGAQPTTAQAAQPESRKLSVWGIGKIASRASVLVGLGAESWQLATAYHEYDLGRISQRELSRSKAEWVFTAGSATAGAAVGAIVGIVGKVAGFQLDVKQTASTGAGIGAYAAGFAVDPVLNWYYREWEFDAQQRRAVNAAVEAFYGLETRGEVVQR